MNFQDKPLSEKKVFYKERQKFFDAIKEARLKKEPVVTYNKQRYKLTFPTDDQGKLRHDEGYGFAVIFNKAFKSHSVVEFHHGNRNGMSMWGHKVWSRQDFSRILCYAEKINNPTQYGI